MSILRLILAFALLCLALGETVPKNLRQEKKPNLDLADIQQGDILNAMDKYVRALSKGKEGLKNA